MTRYARKGPANKKKPLPASDWAEMVPSKKTVSDESGNISSHESEKIGEVELKTVVDEKSFVEDKVNRKRKNSHNEEDIKTKKKLKLLHLDLATALEKQDKESSLEEEQQEEEEKSTLEVMAKKVSRGEQRRLNRIEKRQKEKVCLSCRKPGHMLINCPEVEKNEHCLDICYRCGSGEHKITQCRAKKVPNAKGQFPYANCFICGERGHISRDCPENRNGLYPNGGCCLICGSIYHFQRDCQELPKNKGLGIISLKTADKCRSLDEDPTIQSTKEIEKKDKNPKKSQKIVKF